MVPMVVAPMVVAPMVVPPMPGVPMPVVVMLPARPAQTARTRRVGGQARPNPVSGRPRVHVALEPGRVREAALMGARRRAPQAEDTRGQQYGDRRRDDDPVALYGRRSSVHLSEAVSGFAGCRHS
jgi:hypothetical protein